VLSGGRLTNKKREDKDVKIHFALMGIVLTLVGCAEYQIPDVHSRKSDVNHEIALVPCPQNYPGPDFPPGGGFAIFNSSVGGNHNLEVTVSLKGVEPNAAYDIYWFVDNKWHAGKKFGTVTTNTNGNASFKMNGLLGKGKHILGIDVTKAESLSDIYETPGIHNGEGTVMLLE
jgi:hypothetical protein